MEDDRDGADGRTARINDPGGGPRRVVSSTSVDDILESLETPGAVDDADEKAGAPIAGGRDGDRSSDGVPGRDRSERARVELGTSAGEGADDRDVDSGDDTGADSGDDDTDGETDDETNGEMARDLRGESTQRVDAGTVTGADVRAAETGPGRESTPSIEAIDLSLDDLDEEATLSKVHVDPASGGSSTDGPLAGTLGGRERVTGGGGGEASGSSDRDGRRGPFGWMRLFFPW